MIEESRKYNGRKNEIQHQAAENNSGMPAGIWRYILYHRSVYGAPLWKRDQIGRTTVYRGLERLQKEGAVLKVPSVEGAPAQYRFIRDEERKNYGKLVCLECGHTIPLQCGCIDHFVGHVLDEHGFEIDQSRTIFYGYCDSCRRLKNEC